MNTIVDQSDDVLHEQYVTEDMAQIPFGILFKLIRGQMFFPLALIAAASIKLVTKIKGRSDALNAVCLDAKTVSFDSMPQQVRTSFAGLAHQLPQFRWILYQQRPCLGLRQQFEALALHEDGATIAMCEWQQQMVVVAHDGEDPVKSTESVTTELVSFTSNNQAITTCHVPAESMPAFSLYDDGLGEVDAISNKERLTIVVEKHLARIKQCSSLHEMNEEGAIKSAEQRSDKVVNHFLKLGLIRKLLASEVPKLQKSRRKHAAVFEPQTRV